MRLGVASLNSGSIVILGTASISYLYGRVGVVTSSGTYDVISDVIIVVS